MNDKRKEAITIKMFAMLDKAADQAFEEAASICDSFIDQSDPPPTIECLKECASRIRALKRDQSEEP